MIAMTTNNSIRVNARGRDHDELLPCCAKPLIVGSSFLIEQCSPLFAPFQGPTAKNAFPMPIGTVTELIPLAVVTTAPDTIVNGLLRFAVE